MRQQSPSIIQNNKFIISIMKEGKCVICGKKIIHSGYLLRKDEYSFVTLHRETERKDCFYYKICSNIASDTNLICCPCVVCHKFINNNYKEVK